MATKYDVTFSCETDTTTDDWWRVRATGSTPEEAIENAWQMHNEQMIHLGVVNPLLDWETIYTAKAERCRM